MRRNVAVNVGKEKHLFSASWVANWWSHYVSHCRSSFKKLMLAPQQYDYATPGLIPKGFHKRDTF